jgi:hypothetical protein
MIEYERLGEEKCGLRTAQRQRSTTKRMKGASGFDARAFPNEGCRLCICKAMNSSTERKSDELVPRSYMQRRQVPTRLVLNLL